MCSIAFTIQWEDLDSGLIFDHEGQYKKQGTNTWIPFQFDWDDPHTPFLLEEGVYDMRIRIFDGRAWSDWFLTSFSIGCAGFTTGFSLGFNS